MDDKTTMELKRRNKRRLAHVRDITHASSLDGALERLLDRFELDEIYAAERAATLKDAKNSEVMAEQELWENTLTDGVQ